MFKSLRTKFSVSYIALVLASMLVLGVYLINVLDRYFIDNLRGQLLIEARLVREMVLPEFDQPNPTLAMDKLVRQLGNVTSTRVTIVAADGVVIGDSQESPAHMENHLQRPEIQQSLREGVGIAERESATVKTGMMYLALPIEGEEGVKGFVRLAVPLTEINRALSRMWVMLITALLFATVLAAVLGLKLAERLTQPIQEMTVAAKRMAGGDFSLRTYTTSQDEIGVLGQALNQMAQRLKETIDEVSSGKSKLESVLISMVSGVIFVGRDGRIDLINPAARQILSIEQTVPAGRPHVEIIRNYELSSLIASVLKTRQARKEELLILSPQERIVEVNITPISGQEVQSDLGVVVVLHDITNFRKLERMRADFVANVSHELKTPVTSLKGYAETLLDGALDDPETAREFVRIIFNESERLRLLIQDLLELSKIESKADPVKWQKFDAGPLMRSIEAKFKPQLEARQVELELQMSAQPVLAWGDPSMIEQVLTNLVDNAIKYSPTGTKVKLAVFERAGDILFEVVDSGIGIPQEDLNRIFERFYRVDKARSRKLGGTGLGLAIVKHILETHGSQIQVESTIGRGSRFYFTLPKRK